MREDVVRKLSWGIDSVVMWVLALFMAAETVIVFSAVVSRYVFNYSFAWSDEVARGLLTWLIFLGSTAAYRRGELIDIPFFKEQMSPALTRLVLILGGIATAIFLAYTVRYGWMLTGRTGRDADPCRVRSSRSAHRKAIAGVRVQPGQSGQPADLRSYPARAGVSACGFQK
jgi:TRAP-type C4-dicarboxylate transport system permease small subunit